MVGTLLKLALSTMRSVASNVPTVPDMLCTSLPPTLNRVCPNSQNYTYHKLVTNSPPVFGNCPVGHYLYGSVSLLDSGYYANVTCVPRIAVGAKCDLGVANSAGYLDRPHWGCELGSVCYDPNAAPFKREPYHPQTPPFSGICISTAGAAGDSCSSDSDCISPRICSNDGYCQVPESRRNAPCTSYISSQPCPADQYCNLHTINSPTCTDYAQVGEHCDDFYQCSPSKAGCNRWSESPDDFKCVSFQSLETGENTSDPSLCKSGYAIPIPIPTSIDSQALKLKFVCEERPIDFSFLNKPCKSDSDCDSKHGRCECTQGPNPADNYSRCVLRGYPIGSENPIGNCENQVDDFKCFRRVNPELIASSCHTLKLLSTTQDSCFAITTQENYAHLCSI